MKEVKLTPEEIQELVELRREVSNLYIQIGQLYLEKKDALAEFDKREETYLLNKDTLVDKETKLYNKIGDKYGHGNVNLETGVFTPITQTA